MASLRMAKGILFTGVTVVILIIAGAILYDPIVTIINSIVGVAPTEAGQHIAGLPNYFMAAIAFGIICAFAWVFLWGNKDEYERY